MSLTTRRALLGVSVALLGGGALAQPGYPPMPPPRVERMPPPPPGAYIWRPGHWRWDGRTYVWIPGAYVPRRPAYHEYVPGSWVMRGGRWVWVEPHWR